MFTDGVGGGAGGLERVGQVTVNTTFFSPYSEFNLHQTYNKQGQA